MTRIYNIAAVALFSVALLIASASLGLAAGPVDQPTPSVGPRQGVSGPNYMGSDVPSSQVPPQGAAQGFNNTRSGMTSEGNFSGPDRHQFHGGSQPMTFQRGRFAGAAGQGIGPVTEAIVIGVDQPDNCLRIRRGPSSNYEQIGCARLGEKLNLSRVYSSDNRWAQLENNGWVFACQIKTDFRPPGPAVSCGEPAVGRAWRVPATFGGDFGRTYIYERNFYRPYWKHWKHHHHHGHHKHHGGGPHPKK